MTSKNGEQETYDSYGRPLTIKDERGIGLTYTYVSNKLATVTHTSGRAIQVTWNGSKIASITAPNNKVYGYGYDGNGYLASVTYPDNLGVRTYHYEDPAQPGGLTGISINNVRYSRYAYNADGRAAWSGLEGGIEKSTFTYGAGYTDVKNALGQTSRYSVSSASGSPRVTGVSRPASPNCPAGATDTAYDADGNVDFEVDAYGVKTDYAYDADNRLTQKITGIGLNDETDQQQITQFVWDATRKSRLLAIKVYGNALTQKISETTYTYYPDGDAKARLLKSVLVKNLSSVGIANSTQITDYTYTLHPGSPMIASMGVNGPVDGAGDAVTYVYDTAGNLTEQRNSLGHKTTYASYNALGQPGRIQGPNGGTRDFWYNARGQVTQFKDSVNGAWHTTIHTYDNRGRLLTVKMPDGVATNYEYDNVDRLINVFRVEPDSPYAAMAASITGATSPIGEAAANVDMQPNACYPQPDCETDPDPPTPPPPPTSKIKGYVDGVTSDNGTLRGWACSTYRNESISVHMYVGGAAGSPGAAAVGAYLANRPSEAAVAAACSASSSAYRFTIALTQAIRQQHGGRPIYIHGISPVGTGNLLIDRSGQFKVPALPPPPIGFQKFAYNLASQVVRIDTGIEYTPGDAAWMTTAAPGMAAEPNDGMAHPNLCYPYPDCIDDPPPPNPPARTTLILSRSYVDYDAGGFVSARRGGSAQNPQNVRYAYNTNGDLVKVTDSLNRATTYAYDRHRRVTRVIDAKAGNTYMTYDPLGRLVKATDPRGKATTYAFDGFGQIWKQTSPDTGVINFVYNAAGQRTTMTRADAVVTSYAYDGLGRVIGVSAGGKTQGFVYDNCTYGKTLLCKVTDPTGSVSYTYTPQGWIATQVSAMPSSGSGTIGYAYDGLGRITGVSYPGVGVGYAYANGRLNTVTATVGGVSKTIANGFAYQPFGPMVGLTYGNGLTRGYAFDLDGRLTGLSTKNGSSVLQSLTYGYNANNAIAKVTNAVNASLTQTYGYDELSRLTAVTATNANQTLAYDANGNRTSHVWGGQTDTYATATGNNWLIGINGPRAETLVHNANGNITSAGGVTYSYDAFNRLSSATKGSSTTTYAVNALGQRVYKNGPAGQYWFAYGPDGQLMAEFKTGQNWTAYVRVGNERIAMVRGGQVYYLHNDHLGRPELATNASKAAVWRASNYAFDRKVTTDSVGGLNLGFPGQYYDAETGNWHNGFRDYDPGIGRYLQSDPIGLAGGLNTYAYVSGNPISRIDPMGLEDFECYGGGMVFGCPRPPMPETRLPDYIRVQVSFYVFSGARTLSRSGNMYVSGGVGRGYPVPKPKFQASLSAGWLNQCEEPSDSQTDNFLNGYGMAGAAGYNGIGGGLTWSPGQGTATEVGIGIGGGFSPGEITVQDGSLGGW